MIWSLIPVAFTVLAVLSACMVVMSDRRGWVGTGGRWAGAAFLLALFAVISGAFVTVNAIGRAVGRNECETNADITGRVTEFVSYNWWSYSCFVEVGGELVPFDQWRGTTSEASDG